MTLRAFPVSVMDGDDAAFAARVRAAISILGPDLLAVAEAVGVRVDRRIPGGRITFGTVGRGRLAALEQIVRDA